MSKQSETAAEVSSGGIPSVASDGNPNFTATIIGGKTDTGVTPDSKNSINIKGGAFPQVNRKAIKDAVNVYTRVTY